MKSMLHEASTIIKAIEKAWTDSGKPSEFTIKVLESGEKGFLWFSKKPSIISITYDPRRQPQSKQLFDNKKNQSAPARPSAPIRQKPNYQPSQNQGQRNFSEDSRRQQQPQQQGQQPRQQRFQVKENFPKEQNYRPKEQPKEQPIDNKKPLEAIPLGWTPEFTQNIIEHLKELLTFLAIDSVPTPKIENKNLYINFSKKLMPSAEDEKMLFISISYLLMQFLKKKCKKKLKNFHLVLTSKDSSAHDKNQSGPSER